MYNKNILSSRSFPIPIICVGNLSLGGTGKTPHTEMLLSLLSDYKMIVLSRGYKRKTKGTVFIQSQHSALDVGDEPFQMQSKFPQINFVVDENRERGIEWILQNKPETDIIILDDAFQHRKINAGLNILLTDYKIPFFKDFPIPLGTLRDSKYRAKDADIIIITKCPANLSPRDKTEISRKARKSEGQKVFFSRIEYSNPQVLINKGETADKIDDVILLTGLADPKPLVEHVAASYNIVKHFNFPDHHYFNAGDIKSINEIIGSFADGPVSIFTSEKDAARLKSLNNYESLLNASVFYIPIRIELIEDQIKFQELVLEYVRKAK